MNARPARLPRALAVPALALLLPLTACAGTDADPAPDAAPSTSTSPTPPVETDTTVEGPAEPAGVVLTVQVSGGQVTGDTGRVPVALGEQVTLDITSDRTDEAHLHGYDQTVELGAGTPSRLTFVADVPGIFEVELHEAGTVLLSLQVG